MEELKGSQNSNASIFFFFGTENTSKFFSCVKYKEFKIKRFDHYSLMLTKVKKTTTIYGMQNMHILLVLTSQTNIFHMCLIMPHGIWTKQIN